MNMLNIVITKNDAFGGKQVYYAEVCMCKRRTGAELIIRVWRQWNDFVQMSEKNLEFRVGEQSDGRVRRRNEGEGKN